MSTDLPQPTATGTLAKTPLAHLLVYAQDRELTGTFAFAGPTGQSATVLFIEGQPTKARTSEAAIYLGRVLFELGIVSEEQLAGLLPRLLAGTELHGQVLLHEGVITEEQLELGLRSQLVRQMQSLVRLPPETTYNYYDCFDGLASYGGDGHVGIDPFPVVWGVHPGRAAVGARPGRPETRRGARPAADHERRDFTLLVRQGGARDRRASSPEAVARSGAHRCRDARAPPGSAARLLPAGHEAGRARA